MHWLSRPKVRLALIVNGLYFISLLIPPSPAAPSNFLVQARESLVGRPAPRTSPSAPRGVNAFNSGGRLYVSLNDDLTLAKSPERTLLLSPSFNLRTDLYNEPGWVTLRFTLFAKGQTCPDDCQLVIIADDELVWPGVSRVGQHWPSTAWTRENVPHTTTKLDDGRVMETLGAESLSMELPYDLFLKMINAKQVRITLGADRVRLTAEQVAALRVMHSVLPQQSRSDYSNSH